MSNLDKSFAVVILVCIAFLFYASWEMHKEKESMGPECEKRGGVLVRTVDGVLMCAAVLPNA